MTAPKPHIARELLARAHSPDTAEQLFTERIKQKPLYLRPTSPTPADNRERRRLHRIRKKEYFLRKQKPKPLSAREKRISGLYDLPKEECKYSIFKELHKLWVDYMQEILDLRVRQVPITPQSHGSKLVTADFHGAELEVVRSRCSGRVGVKGIVVRDTKFTFMIVTEKDEVKTIPKEHTIFRFSVPLPSADDEDTAMSDGDKVKKELTLELHGSQFENRPVDRANKKFKWRNVEYL
ncbi:ribonuclease P protein subunit p29 [Aspergillus udagawae]|uniref:Ribonuclease P protein subunit n=1 Tax=Aspergillus udagawae TaxID=91492 RepID=A0ABQ1B915_9EURO|nr:ribonuclease P protein subunit p29 [Aspergillus udagawae]GFF57555.1 ribonuclease P protein subunit p29 [Aspergillus udagawae]GFF96464.1 ribonuclease P protein subunit p29 [Aspergillus udagawae]GFG19442.1 ribonuclease P protein subunit p29 [Aspergillus udagawae]